LSPTFAPISGALGARRYATGDLRTIMDALNN
jgi:hypothetical protein